LHASTGALDCTASASLSVRCHPSRGVALPLQATAALYSQSLDVITEGDIDRMAAHGGVPSAVLPASQVVGSGILSLAVSAGLCKSKGVGASSGGC
jgi:hypothetical protein